MDQHFTEINTLKLVENSIFFLNSATATVLRVRFDNEDTSVGKKGILIQQAVGGRINKLKNILR